MTVRRLGNLKVAPIGYGAMRLTGWPRGDAPDQDTAIAILRRAIDLGVNHVDTSDYYARDGVAANELIRAALYPYPDDLVIVTKVGALVAGGDLRLPPSEQHGLTSDGLRRGVEANLRSLGVDRLDVVNLRMGDRGHETAEIEQPLESLLKLRAEGLIRHIGVSNVSIGQFERACAVAPIVCVQNAYNLTRRDDDRLIDACAEAGIAYVPFYPVGGFHPVTAAALDAVAARHEVSAAQAALAWLLHRSPAILPIPGTGSITHLEENVAAGNLQLTSEDLAQLS